MTYIYYVLHFEHEWAAFSIQQCLRFLFIGRIWTYNMNCIEYGYTWLPRSSNRKYSAINTSCICSNFQANNLLELLDRYLVLCRMFPWHSANLCFVITTVWYWSLDRWVKNCPSFSNGIYKSFKYGILDSLKWTFVNFVIEMNENAQILVSFHHIIFC